MLALMSETGVLFIHGAGRPGREAWPYQHCLESRRRCSYLPRFEPGDPPDMMIGYILSLPENPGHVVAHSYGAITALLLAQLHPERIISLTLIDPAALALSRGMPRTDEHIAAMAPVFAKARDPKTSDKEFSRLFAAARGMPAPEVPDDVLTGLAQQLRATTPPWSYAVDPAVARRIPTLVTTGSAESMYSEVAEVLSRHGAQTLHVPGAGHRPHDHDAFNQELERFWNSLN